LASCPVSRTVHLLFACDDGMGGGRRTDDVERGRLETGMDPLMSVDLIGHVQLVLAFGACSRGAAR
jgi:hypothetical protein